MFYDDMDLLANQKYKTFVKKKNFVYFNEMQGFYFDPISGFRMFIPGDPGGGKSYFLSIVLNQFPNCIMLDPTEGGKFKTTLEEQGLLENWKIFRMSEQKSKDCIKFNICDCGADVIDTIFGKTITSDKKRDQKNAFMNFFSLPREKKTWRAFEEMCISEKLDHYLPDFKAVFSDKDKGKDVSSIYHGQLVIEVDLSLQSLALGIFFAMIKEDRGARKDLDFFGKDFLMLGLDEGQDYAQRNTALGEAIAKFIKLLRKFGIGFVGAGSDYMGFHPVIRKQWNFGCFFPAKLNTDKYRKNGVDILPEDFDDLFKYGFFFFDVENKVERQVVIPDLYFLEVREMLKENKIKKQITGDRTNYSEMLKIQYESKFML